MPMRAAFVDALAVLPVGCMFTFPMNVSALTRAILPRTFSKGYFARRKGENGSTIQARQLFPTLRRGSPGGILTGGRTVATAPMSRPRGAYAERISAVGANRINHVWPRRNRTSQRELKTWQYYGFSETQSRTNMRLYVLDRDRHPQSRRTSDEMCGPRQTRPSARPASSRGQYPPRMWRRTRSPRYPTLPT